MLRLGRGDAAVAFCFFEPVPLLGFGFFLLFLAEVCNPFGQALVFDLVLEERVEQVGVFGGVGAGHHEEASAEAGGVVGAECGCFRC